MQNTRLKPELDPWALARELSGQLLIGGALVPARHGGTFPNVNPATGAVIGQAAEGGAADVNAAVQAASPHMRGSENRDDRHRESSLTWLE